MLFDMGEDGFDGSDQEMFRIDEIPQQTMMVEEVYLRPRFLDHDHLPHCRILTRE